MSTWLPLFSVSYLTHYHIRRALSLAGAALNSWGQPKLQEFRHIIDPSQVKMKRQVGVGSNGMFRIFPLLFLWQSTMLFMGIHLVTFVAAYSLDFGMPLNALLLHFEF